MPFSFSNGGPWQAFITLRVFCFRNGRQDFNIIDCTCVFVKNDVYFLQMQSG